jgi:hypothetical protein
LNIGRSNISAKPGRSVTGSAPLNCCIVERVELYGCSSVSIFLSNVFGTMDRQTPFRNVRAQQNHATRNPLVAFDALQAQQ